MSTTEGSPACCLAAPARQMSTHAVALIPKESVTDKRPVAWHEALRSPSGGSCLLRSVHNETMPWVACGTERQRGCGVGRPSRPQAAEPSGASLGQRRLIIATRPDLRVSVVN